MDFVQHINLVNEKGLVIDVLVIKDAHTGEYRTLNSLFAFPPGTVFHSADEAFKGVFNGLVRQPEGKVIKQIYTGDAHDFLSHSALERLFEEAKNGLTDSGIIT